MPRLDRALAARGTKYIDIARAGEIVRASSPVHSIPWQQWTVPRLEAIYELAFLRAFIDWELFLEQSFYRVLCGYSCRHAPIVGLPPTTLAAAPFRSIADAEAVVLGSQPYVAWYRINTVLRRCQTHVHNGRHEYIINSNVHRLEYFSAIRHRIAHGQEDARTKFDAATGHLAGKVYQGSRPGKFLRDWVPNSRPQKRWLDAIVGEFVGLASQIT